MAHGTPDWWGTEPGSTTHQIQDAGELAVRLGSIVTDDRRGNVVWLEDFERGLSNRWRLSPYGASTAVISGEASKSGFYSAKIQTGAASGNLMDLHHYMPLPVESKIGFEAHFSIQEHVGEIIFFLYIYDGTDEITAGVKYLPGTDKWQYYNVGGTWSDLFTSMALLEYKECFHMVKFVVDYETGEYVRAIANERALALPGVGAYPTTVGHAPQLTVHVEVKNDDANAGIAYIDSLIITQNEP